MSKQPLSPEERLPKRLRNRIVGTGTADPEKLVANPKNWRVHSPEQKEALAGLLDEVGWVQSVIVNKRTGHLLDGHLRVSLALDRKEKSLPVVYVDVSPAEEDVVLALLDPVGDLADIDDKRLEMLLASLDPKSAALASLIADLEHEIGLDGEDTEEPVETLLDQAVQLEPGSEFVIVMCANESEWSRLKVALALRTVRRGGYKAGSKFDAASTDRVVKASRLLPLLERSGRPLERKKGK